MQFLIYSFFGILAVFFIVKLIFCLKGEKMLLRLLLHSALGFAVFILINLTSKWSGVYIPLNEWSFGFTAALGIPAVCGQLILQIFFI